MIGHAIQRRRAPDDWKSTFGSRGPFVEVFDAFVKDGTTRPDDFVVRQTLSQTRGSRARWEVPALVLGVLVGVYVLGRAGLLTLRFQDLDIQADWLLAKAVVNGLDAYLGVDQLARLLDVPYEFARFDHISDASHPRTPAAVLLSLPLVFFEYDELARSANLVGVVLVAAAVSVPLRRHMHPALLGVLMTLLLLSRPNLWSLRFASQGPILAACAAAMLGLRERDSSWPGIALGVAAVLKAFPLLLLLPMLQLRRMRAFWVAVSTIGVLNLAGLALPGVSLGGALRALSDATDIWFDLPSNISLSRYLQLATGLDGRWLIWPVALLGLAVMIQGLARWRPQADVAFLWTASIGVLISPLAWEAYLLFHVPLALAVALRLDTRFRWLAATPLAVAVLPFYGPILLGTVSAVAMVIFSAVVMARDARRRAPGPVLAAA